jgi:hypothetical protein
MSIQNIIDKAQQIEIDRRRVVAQSVSRSQRIKTAERSTAQPWKFKITPPASLPWTASRAIIEVIDLYDRVDEYEITLSNQPNLRYITAYQGKVNTAGLNGMSISSTGTSTITLTNLPTTASTAVVFAAGDFIQPENSRYPYTVTSPVLRGTNTTITLELNRNIITSEGVNLIGQNLKVGNSCTWRVIVAGLPTYQLIPMQRVQFTGDFELFEKVI